MISSSHRKNFSKCILLQCSGLRFDMVHRFPRSIERTKLWLEAFDSPRLNAMPHQRLINQNVCCRHFRVTDYVHPTARTLNFVAVPSLNLKKLDQLHLCRQTEIERADNLTGEEVLWLKTHKAAIDNEDIEEVRKPTKVYNPHKTSVSENTLEGVSVDNEIMVADDENAVMTASTNNQSMDSVLKNKSTSIDSSEATVSSTVEAVGNSTAKPKVDIINDFQLVASEGILIIFDSKWHKSIKLDVLWLRSLCRCSICYNHQECVPIINFCDFELDSQPVMATVIQEARSLEIIWSDGHISKYNLDEIYKNSQSKSTSMYSNNYILWSSQHCSYRDDFKPLKFYDILANEHAALTALDRLQKSGVLIIQDIPKSDKDSVLKKSIISKVFNYLWDNLITEKRTFFNSRTEPFTNCTYESMDKGLQILTLPYYKENLKMELCLVDGFNAASQLPETSYEFLTHNNMDFIYTSKQGYKYIYKQPVITTGGNMERIMYSPYNVENIQSKEFREIYQYMKHFNDILKLKENQWNVKLTTETIIILDNYRICWYIKDPPINGELDCFYMERKHYLNSLNILKNS